MISLEALPKIIDPSQLTVDMDGTLQYDHAQWIDLRLVSILFLQLLHLCKCKINYESILGIRRIDVASRRLTR